MRYSKLFCIPVFVLVLASCRSGRSASGDDGKIDVNFVLVNDVYEIAPLEGGKVGGMARVAQLKQQQLQKNPNTFLLMAGDFLSPSVYGSLTYNGKRIRGAQMVDAMNAAGFDLVGFGNHEFDISEKEFQERLDSSKFQWVGGNAFQVVNKNTQPFKHNVTKQNIPLYYFKTVTDADGTSVKLGFISVVVPSNPASYVQYTDPVSTAIKHYNQIKDSCDVVVALTHLNLADDKRLADSLPQLAVILGGHEHDMKFEKQNGVYITKAHANAKSAFVVKLKINKNRKKVSADPKLVYLDEKIGFESKTDAVVQKWTSIANEVYATSGFKASTLIPYSGDPLEGREVYTRKESTNLTRLIADAMLFAAPQADAAVYNSGSIRVDDVLNPPISQYDILRTLPFGGGLVELEIKGDLLLQVLEASVKNKGAGGWLQYGNISYNEVTKNGSLKGQPIDPTKTYRIITTDFLISGKETNLAFFNEKNPGVVKMYPARTTVGDIQADIRLAIIRYLEQRK
jgi:2',3'-cyclic-nucleotide 2'-phosphodiesterase (5'-nucleotidase family)